jgi:hypothetical protein
VARFTTAGESGSGGPGPTGPQGPAGSDGLPGADGTDGEGFNFRGEWVTDTAYLKNDVVTQNGSCYIANYDYQDNDGPSLDGDLWATLAAKGEDGTDASGGLFYLGDYVTGNGYVANIAIVRGSDNNLYIAIDSGGLQDPVGNTAQWDIFSTNTGGGTADLGDFQFTAGTATVNDNEALILQSKTPTAVKSQLFLNPYGVAKLEAFDNPNVTTFSAANPDWDSATWSVEPGIGSVIQFVNAPNILNWIGSLTTSVYDASLIINGVAAGTVNGFSYSGTDATLYINNTVPTEDPTVNELGFLFVTSSFINIDYDDGSLGIQAKNMNINIASDDDVSITAGGDDLVLRASDDIRFTANYSDSEEEHLWRMDSEGEFHLPGNGLIWNPSNSSGDGYSGDTIHIVPNDSDNETEQRIIIDPTGPNHIHIRAGGVQDYSNVELILGGERAGVRVSDANGTTVVQSKQEDYSWSYQNVGEGGNVYVVATAMAEPDINDFTIIGGQKFVITNVVRDEQNGTTSYETTPGIGFVPFENYTFIRDNGNHAWNFNRAGYLNGPTETGHLRVTGIVNDDGNLEVQADQNLILSGGESNGEYLHDSSDPNNQIATIGDISNATPVETSFTVNGGTTATQPTFDGAPLFIGTYVKTGPMVHFQIQVDMDNITNFGTGQYYVDLPFDAKYGYQVKEGCLHDISTSNQFAIGGHVAAGTNRLYLTYTGSNGQDEMFDFNSPVTLAVEDNFHISGNYITAN